MDTAQHLCLLLREDGRIEEIAISMSRSKMKVSRQWNAMIRMLEGDRFSRTYTIEGVADKNDKNEDYMNLKVTPIAGFTPEKPYKQAEALYEAIASGDREINVNANEDQSDDTAPPADGKTPNF